MSNRGRGPNGISFLLRIADDRNELATVAVAKAQAKRDAIPDQTGCQMMQTGYDPMVMRLIKEAKRYPILAPERERELATAWHDRRDRAALHQLVGSHLRFVVKIAHGFTGYGLPLADLVAEGNVGLMQAAEKFEPARGFRFSSYAIWWIRAAIQEYVIHSWSLVKIGTTGAQKKLFFNLRRVKARLAEFEQGDLKPETVTAIAGDLQVPETAVIEMNRRLGGIDNSLNAQRADDAEGEWIEALVDDRPDQETVVGDTEESHRRRAMLAAALNELKPRERDIVVRRHLQEVPASLQQLSDRYAISCERVRQIELHAIVKITAVIARAQNKKRPFADVARLGEVAGNVERRCADGDTHKAVMSIFANEETAPSRHPRRRNVTRAPALLGAA